MLFVYIIFWNIINLIAQELYTINTYGHAYEHFANVCKREMALLADKLIDFR